MGGVLGAQGRLGGSQRSLEKVINKSRVLNCLSSPLLGILPRFLLAITEYLRLVICKQKLFFFFFVSWSEVEWLHPVDQKWKDEVKETTWAPTFHHCDPNAWPKQP